MTQKLSRKEYFDEYMKCKTDFEYFCRNYILLELPGGDVHFSPYEIQLQLIDSLMKEKHLLILKSRQIGISTIIQVFGAWLTTFYDNVVIGIISKDGPEATAFARTMRTIFEKLPNWMKPPGGVMGRGFSKRTERSFILTNGSKVYASTVNPAFPERTLRGKAITFLIVDEAAFVNNIDPAWTAIVPALSTNQMQAKKVGIPYGTVILSTPNKTTGVGEWFYRRYQNALSFRDIFKPFIIHWKMIPELANDPSWYETQCRMLENDPRKIAQELELKFLPGEGSFFPAELVEKFQDATIEPKKKLRFFNGEAWVFDEPNPNRYYIMGVDTAAEFGQDKSAIQVFDYETMLQVWEYQGKLKVIDFINVIKAAASQYPGLIVIESNSYGNQVLETLGTTELASRLYREKRGNRTYAGLATTPKTRPLIIDSLYSFLKEFPTIVKSQRLALELAGLVMRPSGRIEADNNEHDDLVLSTAICTYVRKYDPPLAIQSADESILGDFKQIASMNMPTSTGDGANKYLIDGQNVFHGNGIMDILNPHRTKR